MAVSWLGRIACFALWLKIWWMCVMLRIRMVGDRQVGGGKDGEALIMFVL